MPETLSAFLIVEKGEPYHRGEIVPLQEESILLERGWKDHQPNISFDSLYVSRRHADIKYTKGASP